MVENCLAHLTDMIKVSTKISTQEQQLTGGGFSDKKSTNILYIDGQTDTQTDRWTAECGYNNLLCNYGKISCLIHWR